jgi:hypothetical protein
MSIIAMIGIHSQDNKKYIQATGGDITTNGDYKTHTFTADGTFSVSDIGDFGLADVLVVAGGAGGGKSISTGNIAGPGGAGGLVYMQVKAVSVTSYSIVIGAGSAGLTTTTLGANGGDSSAMGLTAKGGGKGGKTGAVGTQCNGQAGGCGGGSARYSTSNGVGGTANQTSQAGDSGAYGRGYNGGGSVSGTGGGGGGGAGGAGANSAVGGNGFTVDGVVYSIGGSKGTSDTPTGYGHGGNVYDGNGNGYAGRNGVVTIKYKFQN